MKTPAESVKEMGPEVSKAAIKQEVWDYIEASDIAMFPRPVYHRIPSFKGAAEASDTVASMELFQKAQTVKINPDKPQEQARFRTLEEGKTLLVPTPRLKSLFNKINPPKPCDKDVLRKCATSQGVQHYSEPLGLEAEIKIDLIIAGSVAVSEKGYRIGKGEGFADMEYAMMVAMGAVTKDTIIVSTVHDCQVMDIPDDLIESHDMIIDYIVTPTQVIKCEKCRPKPEGIIWSKVAKAKLNKIPVLKRLRKLQENAGKDVQLKVETNSEREGEAENGCETVHKSDKPPSASRRRPPRVQDRYQPRRWRNDRPARREENSMEQKLDPCDGKSVRSARNDDTYRPRRQRNRKSDRSQAHFKEQTHDSADDENMNRDGEKDSYRPRRPRNRKPNRTADYVTEKKRESSDGERNTEDLNPDHDGEQKENIPEKRRRPKNFPSTFASVFMGNLPRIRVTELKESVRGREVNPIHFIWRSSFAFLHFEDTKTADDALEKLKELEINGRKIRIEKAQDRAEIP